MDTSVLSSTFLLTIILSIGLFFFIRASTKDRTQIVQLLSEQSEELTARSLKQHFGQRAYRVADVDATQNQVTFEGFVRPSLFLAIFLSVLSAVGILCLTLVLSTLFPNFSGLLLGLVLLSPTAGILYWRGAGRPERVSIRVEPLKKIAERAGSVVTVTAHRDELAELQRSLSLKPLE